MTNWWFQVVICWLFYPACKVSPETELKFFLECYLKLTFKMYSECLHRSHSYVGRNMKNICCFLKCWNKILQVKGPHSAFQTLFWHLLFYFPWKWHFIRITFWETIPMKCHLHDHEVSYFLFHWSEAEENFRSLMSPQFLLRTRHNKNEMKMKPATSFKIIQNFYLQQQQK